jgi:hypothetical protein
MLSRARSAIVLTVVLAAAALLHVASADTASAVELPTSMTNDEVGFAMSYPPSWGVTTYGGASQIDFNDGLTFVIVDAFELDALPVRDPVALLQLLVDDLQAFLGDLEMTDERYAYLINLEAPAEQYASYEATFSAMVASFQRGLADRRGPRARRARKRRSRHRRQMGQVASSRRSRASALRPPCRSSAMI